MLEGVARRRIARPEAGIEIALLDFGGDGPRALFHHANGFCAALFAPLALALRGVCRVIAMDARGHGDSSQPEDPDAYAWPHFVDDLIAVVDALAAEPGAGPLALGVGHSFGGTATLAAAARRPDLFGRIVLLDPVVHRPDPRETAAQHRERIARLVERAQKRRRAWASRAEARAWWSARDFFADFDPRVLELYAQEGLRERPDGQVELKCAPEVEAAVFARGNTMNLFDEVDGARVPACIAWARHGNFARDVYASLAAKLPNARIEDVDAGHLFPLERPELAADLIRRATLS
ncbi:MAG: alpha/beta hydrolase [Deltaproteobacteria bacterium]|nr:MAG: alpha/beta hydrolase [Deltaproteobacteria bacterium]